MVAVVADVSRNFLRKTRFLVADGLPWLPLGCRYRQPLKVTVHAGLGVLVAVVAVLSIKYVICYIGGHIGGGEIAIYPI